MKTKFIIFILLLTILFGLTSVLAQEDKKAPVITMTKTEYTIAKGGNAPQPLSGEIQAYYPIAKVNVYIGDSKIPLNYWENKYAETDKKLTFNLNELKIGKPKIDILQGINELPGIYKCKIEVLSYGDAPKTEKSFTIKVVGADDVIKIEKKELMTKGGAKYNKWYGLKDDAPWCAVFQMWCFDQAGLINHVGGKNGELEYPYNWWVWYQANNKAHLKNKGYTPKPGDLIFFDWTKNSGKDKKGNFSSEQFKHIELVEKIEHGMIYTIGGNTGGGCGMVNNHKWKTDNIYIIGYGENNLS